MSGKDEKRAIGFWRCWAISVGVMIGSGIFMLPATLAPFGLAGLLGWLTTSAGVILLAFVLARLANRTERGVGGPYAYARDAFGNLTGFLIGWGYWISLTIAVAAVALALSGYLVAAVPVLGDNPATKFLVALAAIWGLALVNIRGVSEAASAQLILTVMKLIPLALIILVGVFLGSMDTLPEFNPAEKPLIEIIAVTSLYTMWAFIGIEAAVIPADDVVDPERTIPRAVVSAAITVAIVYIGASFAIMMLAPAATLAVSEAPFIEAAASIAPWASAMIAIGAIISTVGSLNGNILVSGQMPMAVALDGLAPERFARRNKGHAPAFSLVVSSCLASALLLLNFGGDLIEVFTFMISISTLCVLAPYAVSALAELKASWKSGRGWALLSAVTVAYIILAASGSGLMVLVWGMALLGAGLPLYFLWNRKRAVAA